MHHSFRGLDYMWVKHYLTGYAQQRAGGGYTVVHDSISAFHDALSVSMNYDGDGGNADGDDHRREGMEVAAAVGNGGGGGDQDYGAVDAEQPLIEPGDVPATAGWIVRHSIFLIFFLPFTAGCIQFISYNEVYSFIAII